jgi:hypothetical protein
MGARQSTQLEHKVWATIHGERGDEWQKVTGTNRFPVQSFLPIRANLPGLGEQQIYLLALDAVEPEIKEKIVARLCEKFGLSRAESESEIAMQGIPILATECTVSDSGMWFL